MRADHHAMVEIYERHVELELTAISCPYAHAGGSDLRHWNGRPRHCEERLGNDHNEGPLRSLDGIGKTFESTVLEPVQVHGIHGRLPPNGSRLSCGRPARRRKAVGRKSVPRQGHNTPFPLERSPPVSFKRLLGRRPAESPDHRGPDPKTPRAIAAAKTTRARTSTMRWRVRQ